MLLEYKEYLLKIRNSLVRNGVELEISQPEGYSDIFNLAESLSDLIWYYTIMEISGSEDRLRSFMVPLNSYYMSKVRDKYYEEYLIYRSGIMGATVKDINNREKELSEIVPESITEDEEIVEDETEDDGFGTWGSYDEDSEDEDLDEDLAQQDYEEVEVDEDLDDDLVQQDYEEVEDGDLVQQDYEEVDDLDDDLVAQPYIDDGIPTSYTFDPHWGKDTSEEDEETIEDEEDGFGNWGVGLDEEEELDEGSEVYEEDEDPFASWGSNDEEIQEDDEEEDEVYEEDEDPFSSWGSSDDEELEEESDQEEDEDPFANWGSSDDEEEDESQEDIIEDDEDPFSSWGANDDEEDDLVEEKTPSVNTPSDGIQTPVKKKSSVDEDIKKLEFVSNFAESLYRKGKKVSSKVQTKVRSVKEFHEE